MLLQPKLNLKVSQRQVLTPGLVQMVSVLALNKLELKEMINTEIVENPVLEEIEDTGVSLDERAGMEGDRERSAEEVAADSELAVVARATTASSPQIQLLVVQLVAPSHFELAVVALVLWQARSHG